MPPEALNSKPEKQPNQRLLMVLLLLLVSLSAGFAGGYFANNNSGQKSAEVSQQIVESESELVSKIAKDVGPSVVSINITAKAVQNTFFGPRAITQESAGTGFIISDDGIIITNRHVIPKDAKEASITLADGTELTGVTVIGRTADSDPLDVAFLKIQDKKGKELKPVKLGDSGKMEIGYKVVAIGNALGQFQNTVTSGILSGYGRSVTAADEAGSGAETLQNLFQTDASINPGNSGGPLVNMQGEVIGINTAVAGNAENISFAIPINDAQGLIKSVLKTGKLERPYLGVRYVTLTDDYAYQHNLDIKRGAYLAPGHGGQPTVIPDSPAAKAGLKEKDIIVKVNDQPIDERNSLISLLGRSGVGEKVTLTIVRDGKEAKIEATLEVAP